MTITPVRGDDTHEADALAHLRELATRARVIRVIHPDLFGRQRGKQFPADQVEEVLDGIAYSKVSLAEDLLGVPVSAADFPALASHPDLHATIDPGTAVVPPWEPDAVWVLAHLTEDGERSPLCARGAVDGASTQLADALHLRAVTACEPEFYLLEPDRHGEHRTPYGVDGVSYTVDRITDPRGSVGRIHRQLAAFGIGVTAINREFSPGQFEVNLGHGDALVSADRVFLLKTAIKELAIIEDLRANFMAKPMSDHEGSSLHVHVSLWDAIGDLGNVFSTPDGSLSPTLLSAIAGVQAHAPAITAFAAPTVNSYKRLHGEGLSPNSSTWGEDDRFSFLRVPAERGHGTRFELRAGDASASPHLLTAAVMHAARDGITRGLTPSPVGVPLPRTLDEALRHLADDAALVDGMGAELVDVYVAIKRAEVRACSLRVSDVEWNLYSTTV